VARWARSLFRRTIPTANPRTWQFDSVTFAIETSETIQNRLYSETVKPSWWHIKSFPLHSLEERRDLLDFAPEDASDERSQGDSARD
jgi:hypothetical protein